MQKKSLDKKIFWPAVIIVFGVSIIMAVNPVASGNVVNAMLSWITYKLDWLFEFGNFGLLAIALWLAFGRYGKVKLGKPEDKPEFSNLTWISMMFCTGIGSSLIYWGVIEPLQYLQAPPFGLEANSVAAADWAVSYGMFHWGIMGWVPAIIPALVVGYIYHSRQVPSLKFSDACEPVIGAKSKGLLGKIIDIFVIFGLMGAAGTSLGVGVPMLSAASATLFGVPESFYLKAGILIIWIGIFGFSVYSGLYKGIRVLSNINVWLVFGVLAFTLLAGPTTFILSNTCNSLGMMFQNFIRMCFYTDPVGQSGFPQGWTVFFYAWWIAYAPLIGIFVARTSKGRTLREVVLAVAIWASLGDWIVFGIFGSYAMHLHYNNLLPILDILANQGGAAAIVAVIASLPFTKLILVVFIVLQFIFMATTLDSAAFVMASVSTKELKGEEQPDRWLRVVWATALGALGFGVLVIGGLGAIQTTSVVGALPLIFVEYLLLSSLLKCLREDFGVLDARLQPLPKKSSKDIALDA